MYRFLFIVLLIILFIEHTHSFEQVLDFRKSRNNINSDGIMETPQLYKKKSHHHRYDDIEFVPHRLRQVKYNFEHNFNPYDEDTRLKNRKHYFRRKQRRTTIDFLPDLSNRKSINNINENVNFIGHGIGGESRKPPAQIKHHGDEYQIITHTPQPVRTKVIVNSHAAMDELPEIQITPRTFETEATKSILNLNKLDMLENSEAQKKDDVRMMTAEDYNTNIKHLQDIVERNNVNLNRMYKKDYFNRDRDYARFSTPTTTINPQIEDEGIIEIIEPPPKSYQNVSPKSNVDKYDESDIKTLRPSEILTIFGPEVDSNNDNPLRDNVEPPKEPKVKVSYFKLNFKESDDKPYIEISTNMPLSRQNMVESLPTLRSERFKIQKLPVFHENEDEDINKCCHITTHQETCHPSDDLTEITTREDQDQFGDITVHVRRSTSKYVYLNPELNNPYKATMQAHINQNSMENEKLTTELPQTGVIRELNKRFFHFGKKSEKKQHPGRIQSDKVKDKLFYEPQAQKYDKNKVQHYPPQNKKITPAFIGPQYTTSSSTRKFDNKQLSSLSNETTEQSDLSLFKELDDINQKLRDSINEVKSYHTMVYGNIHKPGHIVSKMVPPTMDYETTEKLSPRYFWDEDLDQKESPKMNKNYKSNSNAVDSEFRNRMTETDNCKPSCKSIHTQTTHGDPLLRVFANNNYPVQADEINNIAYHPKYKTYREYSTQSSNEYDFGPSFLTEKMDPFLNSDYSRLNQRNIANLMRMKARSKNVEPLEPKYDSIYNRVEPKGSYDLHNVSKISFHAMMPKQFPNKVLTTAMPFETLTNKGTHSNLIFVSEPQGRRGRQGRPQLWHFGAGVKNQPYLVEMKRENPSVDNFGGITNSAFTLVNKRPIIQNQLTSENMDLEDNVPIVYPRHYVLKPLAEDQPNDRINIERKSNDNSNDYISSPTGRLNNLNTNFNRRIGTNNVRVDDLNSKGSSCSPLQSPKMHSQVASYKISTMPYVIPESQIYNIPEPEPCNPPTPAIDDHDDLLACDDTTIPPVPSAGCEAEPITEYTPSIPVEITTCEPETTPMPFKCGTPDETDYDADEIKSSSCPPKSDNSYVQQQRIIHLQDQLTRLEAKDKFYEVERIQMQADAIKSLIPLKQMIVRLMEEIDLILKKIIDMEQFPQSPSVAEQCQSNQNHFNALVEGLTESQRTIKRIESTLEKIAENASDLKEENEIGLDEAKLRMSGISCRLDKEKRRIMDEQNKQLVAQQCKKQTKRRNKKFRLFRWKRMLQEAIDMLSK